MTPPGRMLPPLHPAMGLRRRLLAAPLATGLLLAGCASTPPSAPPLSSPDQPLHLSGRFSISETRSLPEPKSLHNSGRFQLDRDDRQLHFTLYTPFGQAIARAGQQQGQPAWLETTQKQHFRGDSLEQVLEQAIGIPVPVSRLPDWLSDRFRQVTERSADGRRVVAREDQWRIERNDERWFLAWHQPGYRLDIRLVLDPAGSASAASETPSSQPGRTAGPDASPQSPTPGNVRPQGSPHDARSSQALPAPDDAGIVFPPDGTLPDPIPRTRSDCATPPCPDDTITFPPP